MSGSGPLADRRKKLSDAQLALLAERLRGARGDGSGKDSGRAPWPAGKAARLSHQQQRFWHLAQRDPRPDAPICVRFRGGLDIPITQRCLASLIDRHELLRTRYLKQLGGLVVQLADPPYVPVLQHADVAGGPAPERAAHDLIAERMARPFDFSSSRLQFTLIRLSADDHILFVPMHHVSTDGSSVEIFLREFAALYAAALTGGHADLQPLETNYASYAEWQRAAGSAEYARQLDHWVKQLSGVPLAFDIPADRPRVAGRRPAGAEARFNVGEKLRATLAAVCSEHRVTTFMVLLATFEIVMLHYTGARSFAVNCPTAGRACQWDEGVFGCFISPLPMRADFPDEEISFAGLLRQVRQTALAAYENGDAPLERVIETLAPPRDGATPPLGQFWFDMRSFHQTHRLPTADCELVTVVPPPRADLAVVVRDDPARLSVALEYPTGLFRPGTIHGLLGCYEAVLAAALAAPHTCVRALRAAARAHARLTAGDHLTDRP